MTAAAQTSGLPNHSTGEDCLRAVLRWLIALVIIHCLIACGRKLAAGLYKPWGPDDNFLAHHFGTTDRARIFVRVTDAVRRAVELQSELFAHRPTEQGFSIEVCRAIAARLIAIGQDLGLYRRARTTTPAKNVQPCSLFSPSPCGRGQGGGVTFVPFTGQRVATGPPQNTPLPRSGGGREGVQRVCPGAFPGAHPRLPFNILRFRHDFAAA
jgi:hypothetical protein